MEGDIDAGAPLDYAVFQILPAENRYEASVCCGNRVENLAAGLLEQLSPHFPLVKEMCSKESIDNFKLNLPENLNGAAWFTKTTLTRFIQIVASPDLLSKSSAIEDEISQLEEARKFHLSLYSQGHQVQIGSGETDHCNLNDKGTTPEPECKVASSDASRNELVRAMDLRVVALRKELDATVNRAAGASCSVEEITDLARFCEHFGAKKLRDSLCKLLELGKKNQIVDPLNDENSSLACDLRNEIVKKMDGNTQTSQSALSVKPVKYGVSPSKVAQVERQSSSGSDESSYSSDEGQTSVERSRTLARSLTPRRSSSPMRRIQIGRGGSLRTTPLAIKSLNYFPTRERAISHRDNSEEEGSDQSHKKPETNVQRMSVQDAINLFESKQRNQNADAQKQRVSTDISNISAKKSVLRRWSSGMGESSTKCLPDAVPDGSVQALPRNLVDENVVESSVEVNAGSDFLSGSPDRVETAEIDVKEKSSDSRSSSPVNTPSDTPANLGDHSSEKLTASAEWNRLKEAELKSMMMQIKESKPVIQRIMVPESRGNHKLPSEQRGKFYNYYKGKRDKKLQGENTGKRQEKEARIRVTKQVVDQRKIEMASTLKVEKEHTPGKPPKLHKFFSPSSNPKKETSKPAGTKKVIPKDSSLPGRRKSWPSAPLPRTTGTSPARNPTGISSAGSKVMRQKNLQTQSLPQPVLNVERSQQRQKNVKVNHSHPNRNLKGVNEKQQLTVTKSGKTTKMKVLTASGDYSGMVPADCSFSSKITKKSSVVPLESKPFLRKKSGIGPSVSTGIGPRVGTGVVKGKVSALAEKSLKSSEDLVKAQEHEVVLDTPEPINQKEEDNVVSPEIQVADLESETQVNGNQNCDEEKNTDIDQVVVDGDDDNYINLENSPQEIQDEDEPFISPSAIEEHPTIPVLCNDSASQLASPDHVAPVALSSLRVRHSLSQMLQEESSEPDVVEWGNAEIPPTMVYQKDAPKGLKRLLKFARKTRGDANVTGCSSPSAFSEEDDAEESKANGRRHGDNLLRKYALHAKNYGQLETSLCKSYDGQSSTDKSKDHSYSQKRREGHVSTAATTTKATRSFFFLSAFRGSSKQIDPKLRQV